MERLTLRVHKYLETSTNFVIKEIRSSENVQEQHIVISCKICSSVFKVDARHMKSQFSNHLQSKNHKNNENNETSSRHSNNDSLYHTRLSQTFFEAGIPIYKLRHPSIKNFFFKEHNIELPSITTFYRDLDICYNNSLNSIKKYIEDHPIYLIVDETTDALGRFVLNILVGKLCGIYSKPVLLLTTFLQKTNSCNVQQGIIDSLMLLWGKIEYNKFLLLLSDQAAYMLKTGRNLKEMFPKLKHVTCIAHVLNLVCMEIKAKSKIVDEFIGQMKASLSKSNCRKQIYKEICEIPFPPQAILIRWNTWLNAAFFYKEHFTKIKNYVDAIDSEQSLSARRLKTLIENEPVLVNELNQIYQYKFITIAITKLENQGLTIIEQLDILNNVQSELEEYTLTKFLNSINKNPDIRNMENLSESDKAVMMYAPLTTADVERSFSKYRHILSDRRYSFTEANLAKINVIQFNNFIED